MRGVGRSATCISKRIDHRHLLLPPPAQLPLQVNPARLPPRKTSSAGSLDGLACNRCGYALGGLAGNICPECGQALTKEVVEALRNRLHAGRLLGRALPIALAAALLLALMYGVSIGAGEGALVGVRMGLIAAGVNVFLIGVGLIAALWGKPGTRAALAYVWLRALPWAAVPLLFTYALSVPMAIGSRIDVPVFRFLGPIVELLLLLTLPIWGLVWRGVWDDGGQRAGLLLRSLPVLTLVALLVALSLALCAGGVGMLALLVVHR